MSKIGLTRKRVVVWTLSAIALGSATVAIAQEVTEVFVSRPVVTIREGKTALDKVVVKVSENTKLTVIDKDGRWLKVRTPDGKEGWLADSSIAARQVRGTGLTLGTGAIKDSETAAGRGVLPEAEKYASERRLDPSGLAWMEQTRDSLDGATWERFAKEGNVGSVREIK